MFVINVLSGNKVINTIYTTLLASGGTETGNMLNYSVISYNDDNNINVLVKINNDDGIEYIITPEGNRINGNGKKQIALDYVVSADTPKDYIIKPKNTRKCNKYFASTQKIYNYI